MVSPPFRAEHVGSLLRPTALLDLRARFARHGTDRARPVLSENDVAARRVDDIAELMQDAIAFKYIPQVLTQAQLDELLQLTKR